MKLKYLGTAAAEGWPALFCHCPACERARQAGGRNIRTRSQAIIDDHLLIDFPADTYMHVLYHGLDLANITTCIVTHDHSDHFYVADFEMRRQGYAFFTPETRLTVYGTQPTGLKIQSIIDQYQLAKEGRVFYQTVTPFVPFIADDYAITALKADHDRRCDPVIYLIGKADRCILYANDTGYFPAATWQYLEDHRPQIDFVSLDCTFGVQSNRSNHMGLTACVEVKERLIKIGCASEATIFCANHFSHNGKATYDELVPIAKQHGFLVSYDGMEIRI